MLAQAWAGRGRVQSANAAVACSPSRLAIVTILIVAKIRILETLVEKE